jgi:5-methylcytosine-specific restriction protein A
MLKTHFEEKGIRVLGDHMTEFKNRNAEKPWLKLSDIRTARWVKTKSGRLLPLNNAAWSKLRKSVLAEQPLCPECEARGIVEPATEVHHRNDNASDNSRDNLVGLCKPDHSRHTARDMGHNVVERLGCDTSGKPLDPSHPWNKPACVVLTRPDADSEVEKIASNQGATNRLSPLR